VAAPRVHLPRVCVVGAGVMGRWHAHAAERLGASVIAVVDVRAEAARSLAARHDEARPFSRLDDALAAAPFDVVHVCTPLESHVASIDAALDGGCHVLVEKPLAASLAETEDVLERARARGLVVAPVHQLPFQPGLSAVLARRERVGDLVRLSYRTCSAGGDGRASEDRRSVLLEILPHPVSLLCRALGQAFDQAGLRIERFTSDDLDLTASVGETLVDVSISLRGRPTRHELELVGTSGTAFADLFHGYAFVDRSAVSRPAKVARPFRLGARYVAGAGANLAGRALRREPAYPGLRELVRRFYDAALADAEPPIGEAEVLAAARLRDRLQDERG
jgi:predicted dehydrogenase